MRRIGKKQPTDWKKRESYKEIDFVVFCPSRVNPWPRKQVIEGDRSSGLLFKEFILGQ